MKLNFDELVDELEDRSFEDLERIAELARQYAINLRRAEIAENIRAGREEWRSGKLVATDDIDELMRSLDAVE